MPNPLESRTTSPQEQKNHLNPEGGNKIFRLLIKARKSFRELGESMVNPELSDIKKLESVKTIIVSFLEKEVYESEIGYGNEPEKYLYHKKNLDHVKSFLDRASLVFDLFLKGDFISLELAMATMIAIAGHDIVQNPADAEQLKINIKVSEKDNNKSEQGENERVSALITKRFVEIMKKYFKQTFDLNEDNNQETGTKSFERFLKIIEALIRDTQPFFEEVDPETFIMTVPQTNLDILASGEQIDDIERFILGVVIGLDFKSGVVGKIVEYNNINLNIAPLYALRGSLLVKSESSGEFKTPLTEFIIDKEISNNNLGEYRNILETISKNLLVGENSEKNFQFNVLKQFEEQIEVAPGELKTILTNSSILYTKTPEFFEYVANEFQEAAERGTLEKVLNLIRFVKDLVDTNPKTGFSHETLNILAKFEETQQEPQPKDQV